MLALFMANPPPYPLARQQLPGASSQGDGQHAGDGSDVEAEEAAGEAAAAGAGAGERSPGSKKRRRPGLPAAKGTSNGGGRGGRASVKEGDSIEEAAGDSPRGGTLIVCPPALLQQWQAELANHAHGALSGAPQGFWAAVRLCCAWPRRAACYILRATLNMLLLTPPTLSLPLPVEIYEGLRGQQGGLGAPSAAEKRLKPGQREAELYLRLLAGEEIEASFDAEAETAAALRRIAAADVVLTSFDVLRAEVGGGAMGGVEVEQLHAQMNITAGGRLARLFGMHSGFLTPSCCTPPSTSLSSLRVRFTSPGTAGVRSAAPRSTPYRCARCCRWVHGAVWGCCRCGCACSGCLAGMRGGLL